MADQNNIPRELGWDETIEKDSEYVLLPEGDYNFGVMSFERGRHNGSDKLPPCNKATLKLNVWDDSGTQTIITKSLFLHSSVEGLLCSFFTSIGQRKHGEKLAMNWATVVGSFGRCHVKVRNYKKDDGSDGQANEITKFLEPDESVTGTTQPSNYQQGRF
jgi:hypothetical protein